MSEVNFYTDKVVTEYNTRLKQAMYEAVLLLETEAKEKAPVDTGRLRGSITGVVLDLTGDLIEGRVGTNVEYAATVELGSSNQAAQPYLRPALRNKFDEVVEILQEAIR